MTRTLMALGVVSTLWLASARIDAQTSAPSGLTAVVSGTSVTLSWQPPAGTVDTYVLEAGSGSGLSNLVNAAIGTAPALSVNGVPFGTYFVRVLAFSSATGLSAASNEITVVVAPCALAPPANVTSVAIGDIVSLAWSPVTGAESYRLEAGSAPMLANLVNEDIGPSHGLQVRAPSGTYHVRLRAEAPACATSAPSPDTVVRVGTIAGIGFVGVGSHDSAFTTYTESGFAVDAIVGPWTVNRNFGRPLPFIQFQRSTEATQTGQVRVTASGATFRFTSVDLYSSVTPIPFVITGMLNSLTVFTMSGTTSNTFGNFATVAAATGHLPIDTLLISVDNPATPTCPACVGNRVGIDNIAVSF